MGSANIGGSESAATCGNRSCHLCASAKIIIIIIGSKYGSNENYDGNDGFSMPQIENKTRKNALFY